MDLTSLEPVERRSTAAIVADRLRETIMRGTFPPGTQLGEVELATRLGVSRGPLREAMQILVAEGCCGASGTVARESGTWTPPTSATSTPPARRSSGRRGCC